MIVVDALVGLACIVVVLAALGLATMRDALDKLHYAGPVTTLVPVLIALAIVYEEGFTSQAGLKATCIALVMLVSSPIASYVTLRAIVTREHGDVRPPEEPILQ